MTERGYDVIAEDGRVPIKAWMRGVPVEESALRQLRNVAAMPFVHQWVAVMPDVHWGIGATVGSVDPDRGRDHPRGGRRRHRLRDDGGADHASTANDLPETCARCARRSSRRCRTASRSTRAATRARGARRPRPRREAWAELEPRLRRDRGEASDHPAVEQPRSSSARSAPATTSSRCASTRRTASGSCCTRGSRGVGNRIGTLLHRAGEEGHAPAGS